MTADECEFEHEGYCCPPEDIVKAGFICPDSILDSPDAFARRCNGNNNSLMTEEEYDEMVKRGSTNC